LKLITTGRVTFLGGFAIASFFAWVVFPAALYRSVPQPMDFNHAVHAGADVGMGCQDCHPFDRDGRFGGIPPVAQCVECHEDMSGRAESGTSWLSYSRQPDNAWFPHAQHTVLAKLPCERCHGDHAKTTTLRPVEINRISGYGRDIWGRDISGLTQGPPRSMKMTDCENCHAERGVVSGCQTCHK